MTQKCDLEKCSLTVHIEGIVSAQEESLERETERDAAQHERDEAQMERDINDAVFKESMANYMEQGKKEHEILFGRTKELSLSTKWNVKWGHLAIAVGTFCTILAAIFGIIKMAASQGGV